MISLFTIGRLTRLTSYFRKTVKMQQNKENQVQVENTPRKQLASKLETVALDSVEKKKVDEPLLNPNEERFVLFPIKYHEVWKPLQVLSV